MLLVTGFRAIAAGGILYVQNRILQAVDCRQFVVVLVAVSY